MRQRVGFILLFTGMMLLWKPTLDIDQILMTFDYIVQGYWPIGMMCIGIYLLAPKKKKRSKSR